MSVPSLLFASLIVQAPLCSALRVRDGAGELQGAALLSDDRHFWNASWQDTEAILVQLERAASLSLGSLAGLQLSAGPRGGNGSSAAAATKVPASTKRASTSGHPKRNVSEVNKLMASMNLSPKSPADLIPALAMLKAMYENEKDSIKQLNAREKKSKDRFALQTTKHNATLNKIEARFHNHTLSEEFRANETYDENRFFKYWERVRDREHRQFHTSLKIQHGTMQRVKGMIDMYEKAIAGKDDRATAKKELARVSHGLPPEIVFVQLQRGWRDLADFCRRALAEARSARREAAFTDLKL